MWPWWVRIPIEDLNEVTEEVKDEADVEDEDVEDKKDEES